MTIQQTILAAANPATIPEWALPAFLIGTIVQLGFNALVSYVLYRGKQRNDEWSALKNKIEERDAKLHEIATKLVDERFRAMTHEVKNHVQGFTSALDNLKERLKDGDEEFTSLTDRNQKIELVVAARYGELKEFMRETFCTREDQQRHEDDASKRSNVLGEKIEAIGKDVAVLKSQSSPKGARQ